MMTSQIFKYVDSSKIKKFKYLENETLSLFFLQIKHFFHDTLRAIIWQKKSFLVGYPLAKVIKEYIFLKHTKKKGK